jgi:hypothetical protein
VPDRFDRPTARERLGFVLLMLSWWAPVDFPAAPGLLKTVDLAREGGATVEQIAEVLGVDVDDVKTWIE